MNLVPAETLFDEITDFLISNPTTKEIIAFQASDVLNQRLHYLLDENKSDHLSEDEKIELDTFLKIGHLLTMLKAKARLKLTRSV